METTFVTHTKPFVSLNRPIKWDRLAKTGAQFAIGAAIALIAVWALAAQAASNADHKQSLLVCERAFPADTLTDFDAQFSRKSSTLQRKFDSPVWQRLPIPVECY